MNLPTTAGRRGFTAVELMVAVTAAMVVCAGAYTLARTSLEVFQQEARMNAAQFSNVMGMNRLTTDLKRAGYMMSPEAANDPNVCAKPTGDAATLLFAVSVQEGKNGTSTYSAASVADLPDLPVEVTGLGNNRQPDRVRVVGNYAIAESFKLANVDLDATSRLIAIEVDQLSVQRIFRDSLNGGRDFCSYFPAGSVSRLVDNAGKSRFIEVSACATVVNATKSNYSSLKITAVAIPTGPTCGELSGGYINPINIIDYAPIHLTPALAAGQGLGPTLQGVMDQDVAIAGIVGDGSRMELLRRELDLAGDVIPGTAEIVADYVVDLNFSGRIAADPTKPHQLTPIAFEAIGDQPQNQVRQLGVRLSTRARNPDRDNAPNPPAVDQPLVRFRVFPVAATNRTQWARVRTFFSEVNITNLNGIVPW